MKEIFARAPFSLLPEAVKKTFSNGFEPRQIPKDTVLLVQEISPVEKFLVLSKGEAQYYFEQNNEKILFSRMKAGDDFGGIAILLNDAVAIRTLATLKDCVFLELDIDVFLKACEEVEAFKAYFTNSIGSLMLNKSYAGIVARQIKDKEFNLPFFNQPISAIFKPNLVTCSHKTPVREAAKKMVKSNSESIFLKNRKGKIEGIVTDAGLREKFVAQGLSNGQPASAIAFDAVVTIPADAQVFEAFLAMTGQSLSHLAVSSKGDSIIGTISNKDLIAAQANSTYLLVKTIKSARSFSKLENMHSKMTLMLLDPIRNGANPEYITRLITTISDAIMDKVMELSVDALGPPPCRFAFMIMGSEGREEQTLVSDQDNGIVYEDLEDEAANEKAAAYFAKLAEMVCDQLNAAGYKFCDGECMAKNPKWCRPLSGWKKYFYDWIYHASPEDLLNSSIFFDFKGAWGDLGLTDQLKSYLLDLVSKNVGFLRHLTENALHFKPPIGFFGKLVVESKGENKDSLNIKWAMLPIVDLARIYSLKHNIAQTNTLTRLFRLYMKRVFTNKEYIDLIQSYNFVMSLRFMRQITTIIDEERPPDNYINHKNLSYLDKAMLKEIFKKLESFQGKLKTDFLGMV